MMTEVMGSMIRQVQRATKKIEFNEFIYYLLMQCALPILLNREFTFTVRDGLREWQESNWSNQMGIPDSTVNTNEYSTFSTVGACSRKLILLFILFA